MLKLKLTINQYFALKALMEAFEVAEENKVVSAMVKANPYGKISWAKGKQVAIELMDNEPT